MTNDKKYVELIWADKYDRLEKGEPAPTERPNLPFQVVETVNKPRQKDIEDGLFDADQVYPEKDYPKGYPKDWKNILIWGDNKLVMSSLLKQGWAGKINLIYIDPPFFTGSDFSVKTTVHGEEVEKEPSIIEERAYKDTWSGGIATYLKYMHERLALMKDLLAEDGSIYVHLDWHVGHYVKVMMDELFGYGGKPDQCGFRNEIAWCYAGGGIPRNEYPRKHDVILFYTKSTKWIFNTQYRPYSPGTVERGRTKVKGKYAEQGFREEGTPVNDWWADIGLITSPTDFENLYFDTQKPEKLLKRLIETSTNAGDIVADFFCGSGTTLAVAEKLGRRWVGSDLSKFAIQVTRKRLLGIQESKGLT